MSLHGFRREKGKKSLFVVFKVDSFWTVILNLVRKVTMEFRGVSPSCVAMILQRDVRVGEVGRLKKEGESDQ